MKPKVWKLKGFQNSFPLNSLGRTFLTSSSFCGSKCSTNTLMLHTFWSLPSGFIWLFFVCSGIEKIWLCVYLIRPSSLDRGAQLSPDDLRIQLIPLCKSHFPNKATSDRFQTRQTWSLGAIIIQPRCQRCILCWHKNVPCSVVKRICLPNARDVGSILVELRSPHAVGVANTLRFVERSCALQWRAPPIATKDPRYAAAYCS